MSAESKSSTPEFEPTCAPTAMPVWLIAGTLLLLLWSAVYFDRHGGCFEASVYAPYASHEEVENWQPPTEKINLVNGKKIFEAQCAICHNSDGMGKPGQFPPLAGSEWVNAEGANRIIRIPLLGMSGPIEVKGQMWNTGSAMPNFNLSTLSDKDLSDVLSYVRQAWGNKAPPVTEEQVKAVRKELGGRTQALTPDELKKVPEKAPEK